METGAVYPTMLFTQAVLFYFIYLRVHVTSKESGILEPSALAPAHERHQGVWFNVLMPLGVECNCDPQQCRGPRRMWNLKTCIRSDKRLSVADCCFCFLKTLMLYLCQSEQSFRRGYSCCTCQEFEDCLVSDTSLVIPSRI